LGQTGSAPRKIPPAKKAPVTRVLARTGTFLEN
jgi:hypothetical protein